MTSGSNFNPPKPHPKKLTDSEWRALCDEWESSGIPQKQFCQAKDICYAKFVVWRSKILTERGKSRTSSFVKVNVADAAPRAPAESGHIQVRFPTGVSLVVSGYVEKQVLSNVLSLLSVAT